MLEEKDAQILGVLRRNAREKLTTISEQTGIPTSTVHERLRTLMKDGLRMVSLLDYPRIHMPIQCWILLSTRKKEEAIMYLQETGFVNVLLIVNNLADIACECVFSTFKQQHTVIEDLKRFGKVRVYPVIEEVGRELACPLTLHMKK